MGDQNVLHRLLSFALFQSLLNSLSTTTWCFEWEGVTLHQIKVHIQMHFHVQCTLKSLLRKLYDPALQCNFCIKAFYHNGITNSNLFISFLPTNLVFSQTSKCFFSLYQWPKGEIITNTDMVWAFEFSIKRVNEVENSSMYPYQTLHGT